MFEHTISATDVADLIASKRAFVLNIVTEWCPDCTDAQKPHTETFAAELRSANIEFYNLIVQKQKGEFLSELHEAIVESAGGHGYPRTVLWNQGQMLESDHIEVTELDALLDLANKFIQRIA